MTDEWIEDYVRRTAALIEQADQPGEVEEILAKLVRRAMEAERRQLTEALAREADRTMEEGVARWLRGIAFEAKVNAEELARDRAQRGPRWP